jgi:hypothetical protein
MNLDEYTDDQVEQELKDRGIRFLKGATRNERIRLLREDDDYPGRVEVPNRASPPQISSLVQALENRDERASETFVVRGYLGRSNLLERINEYLHRAEEAKTDVMNPKDAIRALCALLPDNDDEPLADEIADVNVVIGVVSALGGLAADHVPWRIYLTPRLDRYIDFHFDQMLAYRQEPKAESKDACTVWLRLYEPGRGDKPIPYRVVKVTNLVPSYAGYLGGDLVDDYLDQPGSQSSAWGTQAGLYGGGGKYTTSRCTD